MVELVVLNGSRAGARFGLPDVPAVVGRSPEAHVRIDDPWISNLHALFELRGGVLWVVDLDSRNGTFVGAERVGEAQVPIGAILAFGRTEVRIDPPGLAEGPGDRPARTPIRFDPTTLTTRAARPEGAWPASGDADAGAPGADHDDD